MNRLFRGMEYTGCWVYGYLTVDCNDTMINHHIVLPETVGQWTGAVDHNGVKIFEGDIIVQNSHLDACDIKHVVEWSKNPHYPSFDLNPGFDTEFHSFVELLSSGKYAPVVIGSIHDKPICRDQNEVWG